MDSACPCQGSAKAPEIHSVMGVLPWSLPSWDEQGQALSEKVDKKFSHKEIGLLLLLPPLTFRGIAYVQ